MAFDAEERMANETVVASVDEVTHANEDWPVAELYRVEPDGDTVPETADSTTDDTVVMARTSAPATAGRRVPPVGPGVLVAIASAVAAVILVAVLIGLRDGDEAATERPPTTSSRTSIPTGNPSTPTSTETRGIEVLRGTSLEETRPLLEKEGLRIRIRYVASGRPRGEIVNQAPPPGTKLNQNDVVTLVVSTGQAPRAAPKRARVPSVVGLRASAAVIAIRDEGFEWRIRFVTSSEPAGTVIRQSPDEGAEAVRGSEVVLILAKNRPDVQRVEIPDVVGTSVDAARRVLRTAGFSVTVVSVRSEEPTGQVLEQSPSAGVGLREGATVTLRVSSGPALVDVPDVTGLDEQSARLELENAGFSVRVTAEPTLEPAEDGVVVGQTPPGGSGTAEGALVTLTVARLG
jgi:beta-lactam-binding protein with PASTA domain